MNAANAKELILNLFLASEGEGLSTREAIASCALFGIPANSVRVTLVRLSSAGLIEAVGRGAYQLGPNASSLAQELSAWKTMEARVGKWSGGWVMVLTGGLGRSDRPAMNRRQRALDLQGFRELERGLYLRPDNLAGGVAETRDRLHRLGLEKEAVVCQARDLDDKRERQARALWDGAALNAEYRKTQERIERWLAKAEALDLPAAARESFLLGNAAIRRMIYDPLLPAPLVDVAARQACLAAVHRIDKVGHDIWRRLRMEAGGLDDGLL